MLVKFFFILDVFTALLAMLQAQNDNRNKNSQQPVEPFELPNYARVYALQYPEIASTIHRTPCGLSCDKIHSETPIENDKKYLVYYEPSAVILPSNLNWYLPMFRNNYEHNTFNRKPEKKAKNIQSLKNNYSKNLRVASKDTGNVKNDKTDNSKREHEIARNYPKVPATYLKPPKVMTKDYLFYSSNEKTKPTDKNAAKHHADRNKNRNHKLIHEEQGTRKSKENDKRLEPTYVRDHAPVQQKEDVTETESTVAARKQNEMEVTNNSLELSPDGDRVEFQIQGHDGPRTYIFGFDTGNGKNRQYRLEEKLKNGTVKGHYGYYDAKGKLRAVKYVARPLEGYEERHHETNTPKTKD